MFSLVYGLPLSLEVIPGEQGPLLSCQHYIPRILNGIRHTIVFRSHLQNRKKMKAPLGRCPGQRPSALTPGLTLQAWALVSEYSKLTNFVFLRIQALAHSGCQQEWFCSCHLLPFKLWKLLECRTVKSEKAKSRNHPKLQMLSESPACVGNKGHPLAHFTEKQR